MRILITNDDGLYASQLIPLIRWAQKLGEVTTVVPKYEQSGKSHGIEIHKPFEAAEVELAPGITAIAVDSTPADCVRYAILGMHREFDLVISGINRGLNIGRDIMYSGTVAAAFEAANLGIRALAVSTEPKSFDTTRAQLDCVWAFIQSHRLLEKTGILNINIPHELTGDSIRITRQGGPYYSDDFHAIGNDMYLPVGLSIHDDQRDFTLDTDATLNGYITITPLTIDRTDFAAYNAIQSKE